MLSQEYHQIYALTDDRRRNAFYWLYYTLAVIFILFSNPGSLADFHMYGLKINQIWTCTICPAAVLFLYLRYLYLCAHTVTSFAVYLTEFRKMPSSEKRRDGELPLGKLYTDFQRRDFSEHFNIFLFPRRYWKWKDVGFLTKKFWYKLFNWVMNFANLACNCIPVIAFYYALKLLRNCNPREAIFWSYIIFAIIAVGIVSISYRYITHAARETLTKEIYKPQHFADARKNKS